MKRTKVNMLRVLILTLLYIGISFVIAIEFNSQTYNPPVEDIYGYLFGFLVIPFCYGAGLLVYKLLSWLLIFDR